jgi:transposase
VLLLPRAVRILLAAQPVDLRNSIDGLAALVRTGWGENVYAGHLFVFVSRRRDRVKILSWDNGGFVVWYKRLEQGRFKLPAFHDEALGAQLDATQLTMLLDGIDVSHVRRPKKWDPLKEDRQKSGSLINPDRWQSARRAKLTNASGASGRKSSRPSSLVPLKSSARRVRRTRRSQSS